MGGLLLKYNLYISTDISTNNTVRSSGPFSSVAAIFFDQLKAFRELLEQLDNNNPA